MMKRNRLKGVRIITALLFFVLTTVIFLDFTGIVTAAFMKPVVFLQLVPSLIRFIHLVGYGSAGFIVVILLTALFGRVYCSTICPVGTFQDVVIFLRRKFSRKKRFRYLQPRPVIRVTILLAMIITVVAGTTILVNLLDPFSNFGRMITNLVRPAVIGVNNLAVSVMGTGHSSFLKPVDLKKVSLLPLFFSLVFMGVLLFFSLTRGRQYCNLICPVGTLLGYLSKISLFRIKLDKALCNRCGACLAVCKAGCIDVRSRELDFTRCVGCFNCLKVCPSDGVKYRLAWNKVDKSTGKTPVAGGVDHSKRKFLAVSGVLVLTTLHATIRSHAANRLTTDAITGPVSGSNPVPSAPITPPGSVSYDHLTGACTACHLCVAACPSQVLQPSLLDYGWMGIMQPKMDYMTNYCSYECTVCSEICPSGAILPLTLEGKKTTQLGRSRFIKEECIVYTKNTACGACSEHCPTKAVNMVPYQNGLTIPEVNNEICVGCGACQYSCPTDPKAIVVDANRVHLPAKLPEEVKVEKKIDYKEEFPF
jgi:polyferredoxin